MSKKEQITITGTVHYGITVGDARIFTNDKTAEKIRELGLPLIVSRKPLRGGRVFKRIVWDKLDKFHKELSYVHAFYGEDQYLVCKEKLRHFFGSVPRKLYVKHT